MSDEALIMIGPSGIGKSTFVKEYAKDRHTPFVCSADDFPGLYGENGINFRLLGEAHKECFLQFIHACEEHSFPVVDNTNCSMDQLAPYVRVATAFEREVKIVAMIPQDKNAPESGGSWHKSPILWEKLALRNKHGTPARAIKGMMHNMKIMLDHWPNYFPEVQKEFVLLGAV